MFVTGPPSLERLLTARILYARTGRVDTAAAHPNVYVIQEDPMKARLVARGATAPAGETAADVDYALRIASRIGWPVMIKAVSPVGDRGGRGLVGVGRSAAEVSAWSTRLLGSTFDGHVVEEVRIEAVAPPGEDHYLAFTFDYVAGAPTLLWGRGGSGVESWLTPEQLSFELNAGPGFEVLPRPLQRLGRLLFDVFCELGARLVETNPVRLVGGSPVVLDAKAVLDPGMPPPPDATWIGRRQSGLGESLQQQLTDLGTTAKVQFEELGGEIGLVMWGGGSTMIVLDALFRCGLRAANYSDMAAGTHQPAVIGLLTDAVLLQQPRGLLVGSTVSSALSASEIATTIDASIARHLARPGEEIPVAVRLAGEAEAEARALLQRRPNVRHFGREETLEDAVEWLRRQLVAR
jgi:succinyl-CoA synthetase beta subunit